MLGVKKQKPDDRLDYDIDFSRWLSEGDTITDAASTADEGMTVDAVQPFGQKVKVWVSGGISGRSYRVTITATTQEARVKEACFQIRISECSS